MSWVGEGRRNDHDNHNSYIVQYSNFTAQLLAEIAEQENAKMAYFLLYL